MEPFAIIIPAYNETGRISSTLAGIREITDADIIVVDDGSKDGTAAEGRAAGALVITLPFNLGYPVEFTILELAEKTVKMTGSKSKITFKPLPSDDPRQRQPDIALAKKVLGWDPGVRLEDGLKRTIEYFRDI